MTKGLRIAMAAVTAGAAVLSAAAPASAGSRHWNGYKHHDHDDDVAAAAVVAGVLGLVVGAAIMSSAKRTPVVHTVQRGDFVRLPAEDAQPAYAAAAEAEADAEAAPAQVACTHGDWAWDSLDKRYVWVTVAQPC